VLLVVLLEEGNRERGVSDRGCGGGGQAGRRAGGGRNRDREAFSADGGRESEEGDAARPRELRRLKGGVERSELTWRPDMWGPMPH
jgi:hypothetical protein